MKTNNSKLENIDVNKQEINTYVDEAIECGAALPLASSPIDLQRYSNFALLNNDFAFAKFDRAIPKLTKSMRAALGGRFEPQFFVRNSACYFVVIPRNFSSAHFTPVEALGGFTDACQTIIDEIMFRRALVEYRFEDTRPWEPYEKGFAEGIFVLASLLTMDACQILFGPYAESLNERGKELLRPKHLVSGAEKQTSGMVKQINEDSLVFSLQTDTEMLQLTCQTQEEYDYLLDAQKAKHLVALILQEYTDVIGILSSRLEKRFMRLV